MNEINLWPFAIAVTVVTILGMVLFDEMDRRDHTVELKQLELEMKVLDNPGCNPR